MLKKLIFLAPVFFLNFAHAENTQNTQCDRDLARMMQDGLTLVKKGTSTGTPSFNKHMFEELGRSGLGNTLLLRDLDRVSYLKSKDALGRDQLTMIVDYGNRFNINSDGSVEILNVQNSGLQNSLSSLPKGSVPKKSVLNGYLELLFTPGYGGHINDKRPATNKNNTLQFEFIAKTGEAVNVRIDLTGGAVTFTGAAGKGYGVCSPSQGAGSTATKTATPAH